MEVRLSLEQRGRRIGGEEEGKEEAGREWKSKRRVGNGQGGEEDKMGKEVERRKGR